MLELDYGLGAKMGCLDQCFENLIGSVEPSTGHKIGSVQ